MSFLFKLTFFISFVYSILSLALSSINENQSPNYDNYFFDKDSSFLEYYLLKKINSKYNSFSPKFINNLIAFISEFWIETKFIPSSYIFNSNFSKCVDSLNLSYFFEFTPFRVYFEGSGKHMNDLGNEQYCINSDENSNNNSTNNKLNYYLVLAYLEHPNNLTNDEDKIIIDFLNQNYFYMGFCLPKDCKNIFYQLINDKYFLDFLYYKFAISNFTLTEYSSYSKIYKDEYSNSYLLKLFLLFIFLIKFIVGSIRLIRMTKGYERFYNDNLEKKRRSNNVSLISMQSDKDDDTNEKDEDENENKGMKEMPKSMNNKSLNNKATENISEIKDIYIEYIYGKSSKNEINLFNPFYDNQDKYPLYLKFIKFTDLFDNIKTLITFSNKYYNSCNIKRIYFLKFVVMFMSVILNLMIIQIKFPTKNFLVYNFYHSSLFFMVKVCTFSTVFWITLDAVTTGFKLMSYIKKKIGCSEDNKLKFISVLEFLLLLIPKIALFIICFYLLYIYSDNLTYSLINEKYFGPFIFYLNKIKSGTYIMKHLYKNFFLNLKYLTPFYINYIDYFTKEDINKDFNIIINGSDHQHENNASDYTYYQYEKTGYKIPSPFLTNAELFINIYLNEFVLLIFMLAITYISYKIRHKLFDYYILVINIILYIFPIFNLTKYEINVDDTQNVVKYTLPYVLGQNFSEKYTHYCINFYYFGFIIGVMMFYYNENMFSKFNIAHTNINNSRQNSSTDENAKYNLMNMLPFSFCNDIIKVLYKLKFWIKRMILWICLAFIIFLSFISISFTIEKDKIVELNNFNIFIFLYEKNLCCIFFFILLLMFVVYPQNTGLIKFSQLNFFILFDRINFSFLCTINYIISAGFCVFYVDYKLTYINLFLISLGFFSLIIVFNIFFVTMFELPFRMLVKSLMNKNVNEEFRVSIASGGLLSHSNRTSSSSI